MSDIDAGIKVLSDAILGEREALKKEADELRVKISLLDQRILNTDLLLEKATHERDHYMRQVAELSSVINALGLLLRDSLEKINHGTYRPNGNIPAPTVEQLEADIADLARKLHWNNGEKVHG